MLESLKQGRFSAQEGDDPKKIEMANKRKEINDFINQEEINDFLIKLGFGDKDPNNETIEGREYFDMEMLNELKKFLLSFDVEDRKKPITEEIRTKIKNEAERLIREKIGKKE